MAVRKKAKSFIESELYPKLENEAFAEELYPETLYDIVDFLLRECIKREQPIRKCKNCQKYFAIHGRTDTE